MPLIMKKLLLTLMISTITMIGFSIGYEKTEKRPFSINFNNSSSIVCINNRVSLYPDGFSRNYSKISSNLTIRNNTPSLYTISNLYYENPNLKIDIVYPYAITPQHKEGHASFLGTIWGAALLGGGVGLLGMIVGDAIAGPDGLTPGFIGGAVVGVGISLAITLKR
jgi:hypothetical protein